MIAIRPRGARRPLPSAATLAMTLGIALGSLACGQGPEVGEQVSSPPAQSDAAAQKDDRGSPTSSRVFHVFSGIIHPRSGVFTQDRSKTDYERIAKRVTRDVTPARSDPRRLGFAVRPLALDQRESELRQLIGDAVDIALATDLAVASHLDDYMFWKNAKDFARLQR